MTVLNLGLFSLGLVFLGWFYNRSQKLGVTVFIGLLLGLASGLLLQTFYEKAVIDNTLQWVNLIGSGYVRLLQMIVMPLVFISILSAITRLNQASSLGKISLSVLSVLMITTALPLICCVIWATN